MLLISFNNQSFWLHSTSSRLVDSKESLFSSSNFKCWPYCGVKSWLPTHYTRDTQVCTVQNGDYLYLVLKWHRYKKSLSLHRQAYICTLTQMHLQIPNLESFFPCTFSQKVVTQLNDGGYPNIYMKDSIFTQIMSSKSRNFKM